MENQPSSHDALWRVGSEHVHNVQEGAMQLENPF